MRVVGRRTVMGYIVYPMPEVIMPSPIDPEVGRRVEALRRRSGLSRERLADLAGCSPTLIKFVENGRRALTLRAAQLIAPHLGVRDLGDLYGPSVRLTLDGRPSHPSVPEVRRALTSWQLTVDGEPPTPEYLHGALDAAWRTWHTSRDQRSQTGAMLPGLLESAQRAARLHEGVERRRSLSLLSEAYHLAQAYLAWHGDRELMWLTVDRGMSSALDADDPLTIASATWYAAHLLRAVGRSEETLERLAEARGMVETHAPEGNADPRWPAQLADLWLCSALTRARMSDQGAWADWERAAQITRDQLPIGYVHPWTRVGPVLVDVYAVMIAVELGDADEAQQRAHHLDPASIPSTERRARHFIELARGTDLEGSREGTLHLLQRAEAVSTETVRYSPVAREMVGRLVTEGSATIRADAEALANRIGLPL